MLIAAPRPKIPYRVDQSRSPGNLLGTPNLPIRLLEKHDYEVHLDGEDNASSQGHTSIRSPRTHGTFFHGPAAFDIEMFLEMRFAPGFAWFGSPSPRMAFSALCLNPFLSTLCASRSAIRKDGASPAGRPGKPRVPLQKSADPDHSPPATPRH
jgi:hypothetical protein